ncbi:hypothetical protein [Candidatus Nitrospira bockiana]
MKKEIFRVYLVDECDRVHRLPLRRYEELLTGRGELAGCADRAVRLAEVGFGLNPDRSVVRAIARFPVVHLGPDGRRDPQRMQEEQSLATRESLSMEGSEWQDLYRAQRLGTFRWEPSGPILEQLRNKLPRVGAR